MSGVLITGASGFVGACLARRLLGQGRDVNVFIREASDLWRLADIQEELRLHRVDLCDQESVERSVKEIQPQHVFHLAAYGGFSFQTDAALTFRANLSGTEHLLSACLHQGFKLFVNTGSSSEYGEKSEPMRECDVLAPQGAYAVAKAAATMSCRSLAIAHAANVINLRLFSPYGPWEDARRLIPYVITSLLGGEPPRLSTPDSVRDYVYIDDVLDAFEQVMETEMPPGEILNIGSGRQHSIGEVVDEIIAATGSSLEPQWGAAQPQRPEPASWVADISQAERLMGWSPATSLAAGIRQDVDWFQEYLALYSGKIPS